MMNMNTTKKSFTLFVFAFFIYLTMNVFAGNADENETDNLLRKYIASKDYKASIIFDSSNIKQYWVEKSVISQDDSIKIYLNDTTLKGESLKIQLANIDETLDCKVDVITQEDHLGFTVEDSKAKVLSSSTTDQDFIDYHIFTSSFHLEDTQNDAFYLRFQSNQKQLLSIKMIVLSFSKNNKSSFFNGPGILRVTKDDCTTKSFIDQIDDKSFSLTGKESTLVVQKNILVRDNTFNFSVKIKNTGSTQTRVYVGFAPYRKDRIRIRQQNNPYKEIIKTLKVVQSEDLSPKIIVDEYSEWAPKCYLALNAKDDFSDFPYTSLADYTIVSVNKLDNGNAEIILEKPLKKALEKGTLVRIHSPQGAGFVYTNIKVLQPGEEAVLSSTVKRDDSFLRYSPKAICKGTYYIQPILLSNSVNPSEENTVLITDFSISY